MKESFGGAEGDSKVNNDKAQQKTEYSSRTRGSRRRISPIICVLTDPENIYQKSTKEEQLEMDPASQMDMVSFKMFAIIQKDNFGGKLLASTQHVHQTIGKIPSVILPK
ncbi:hypothetical protein KIN20_035592 [Parelaphostrongylus tenuis]|uniref:Uncharacterized protein n=1 Tax=Parelaphostrongylus tenuis TaxID=148309 RepID=A0AAD5RBD3_PARTN|nr:hypothetical protein KIN20_035592 [Parelaphostrongylus tenuis]